MGIFEPGVNLEKEQKMLEKHNPYEWIRSWFRYTYDGSSYWTTHFRIAEKGIVFYQATESGADLRIPWSSITDVGWNDIIGWTGRRDTIHWLRGIARIIESNMGSVENSDG